ncbi:restriction endonuclease subunit S [Companilactobacillus suantsaicola]|uniref:Restriction endonuclease subunit S n=1 Tax=Companilactobacillus suantsaicola TaxID=2487723 RepID=A0A4Z0JLE4_9LACO|nr:restriction endonuclease subunit S [Companilactobacillus suantsaicola]TGD23781.1 restriction endonuclease subunit S [Companilactobacillus suantsaicola]
MNKEKAFFGSGVPIVNFVDVFHNRILMPDMLMGRVTLTEKEIKNHEIKQGDIFFTRTSETINEIGYPSVMLGVPDCTVFSGFVLRGRAIGDDPLNNLFKSYIFFTEHFRKEMIKKSSMTTRALTSGTALKEMIIKFPASENEQTNIGILFKHLDVIIALQQRQLDLYTKLKKGLLQKLFPKDGENVPEIRFADFHDDWEHHKFNEIYKKETEKNDLSFGSDKIISVAKMYFKNDNQDSKVDYMKTYNIFRVGDIAFEGNKSKNFKFGRFVENTIGDGIVSHVFDVFRPINLDSHGLIYWKYAIHDELFMRDILRKATTHATMMTNLVSSDFLKQTIRVPCYEEQNQIGNLLQNIDNYIESEQSKLKEMKILKKYLLQKLFI